MQNDLYFHVIRCENGFLLRVNPPVYQDQSRYPENVGKGNYVSQTFEGLLHDIAVQLQPLRPQEPYK